MVSLVHSVTASFVIVFVDQLYLLVIRAFLKKLQLLWLSLNEGFFPTQLRVPKDYAVLTFDKMECRNCERTRESTQMQLFQQG